MRLHVYKMSNNAAFIVHTIHCPLFFVAALLFRVNLHVRVPSKHETFVQCWANVYDVGQHCTHVVQMFCACWV